MTFEPIPFSSTKLTIVEGPSRDNFHINDAEIAEQAIPQPKNDLQITDSDSGISETMPSFPGGTQAMYKWVAQHLKYPDFAAYKKIKGRVLVKFAILSDGSIGETQIAHSVHPDLDAEAVRLVKAMPKWNPGMIEGEPVSMWHTLPVTFNIQ